MKSYQLHHSPKSPQSYLLPTPLNGRSNTLDRKLKSKDSSLPTTSIYHSPTNKFYSSSLERNNSNRQHDAEARYSTSTASSMLNQVSMLNKRPLSQDTILENPNSLFASASNDDIQQQIKNENFYFQVNEKR